MNNILIALDPIPSVFPCIFRLSEYLKSRFERRRGFFFGERVPYLAGLMRPFLAKPDLVGPIALCNAQLGPPH